MDELKIELGSKAYEKGSCVNCGKQLAYESSEGLCPDCTLTLESKLRVEQEDINAIGAVGLGFIGAVAGAAAWSLIAVSTDREVGYIAIGIGYLTALCVNYGAGKKKTVKLQALAVIYAIFGIALGKAVTYMYFMDQYFKMEDPSSGVDWVSPFNWWLMLSESFKNSGPIGFLIVACGIYFAFKFSKPTSIQDLQAAKPKKNADGIEKTEIPWKEQYKVSTKRLVKVIGLVLFAFLGLLAILALVLSLSSV
ncbi:MAG TPA: hypothetical protein VEA59_03490 [Patescibacteria group bacterium]|nr:hypothetical protein [Patescibacteria group bacterium]